MRGRKKKTDSAKEGARESTWVQVGVVLCTGLVAWLEVTFSPTVHLYCSQSYLGVLADDK